MADARTLSEIWEAGKARHAQARADANANGDYTAREAWDKWRGYFGGVAVPVSGHEVPMLKEPEITPMYTKQPIAIAGGAAGGLMGAQASDLARGRVGSFASPGAIAGMAVGALPGLRDMGLGQFEFNQPDIPSYLDRRATNHGYAGSAEALLATRLGITTPLHLAVGDVPVAMAQGVSAALLGMDARDKFRARDDMRSAADKWQHTGLQQLPKKLGILP